MYVHNSLSYKVIPKDPAGLEFLFYLFITIVPSYV